MSFYPSMQALLGPNTPQNASNIQCAVDWSGTAWIIGPHPTMTGHYFIAQQNIFTGTELQSKDCNTYTPTPSNQFPIAADPTGNLWIVQVFGANLIKIAQSNLAEITSYTSSVQMAQGTITPKTAGSANWIVNAGPGSQSAFSQFVAVNVATGVNWTAGVKNFGTNNLLGFGCVGPASGNLAYVITSVQIGSADTHPVTLFKLDLGAQTSTTVGTISPSAVDAGWTTMSVSGICLDQTDNKLLVWFDSSSGGSSPHYFCKIDPSALTVSWATAVPNFGGSNMMAYSQVTASTFYWYNIISGGAEAYTFNTTNGTFTTYTNGLARVGAISTTQASNDKLGAVISVVQFAPPGATDYPTLLNSTPLSFSGWALLYLAPGISPPTPGSGRRLVAELGPVHQ